MHHNATHPPSPPPNRTYSNFLFCNESSLYLSWYGMRAITSEKLRSFYLNWNFHLHQDTLMQPFCVVFYYAILLLYAGITLTFLLWISYVRRYKLDVTDDKSHAYCRLVGNHLLWSTFLHAGAVWLVKWKKRTGREGEWNRPKKKEKITCRTQLSMFHILYAE